MKKIFIISLLAVLTGSLVLVAVKPTDRDQKRKKYESFLLDKAKQISGTNKGAKGPSADNPEMAALQNYLMTVDPALGRVPHERLLEAYRATEKLRMQKSGSAALLWHSIPSVMGGRTRAIMWDPNDPQQKKVWAGGVTGGLWYNNDITDANSSWIPVGDFWSCLAIRCITYDPNDPMTFYVGTGEPETAIAEYRESSGLGDGIWKSTDGGQTWNKLPSTSGFAYITDIVVKPDLPTSTIYAGVVSGLYHGIHNSQPSDGLFRSADGGATWTQVLPNIPGFSIPFSPSDIAVTADGSRIFVGTRPNVNGDGAATILRSDNGNPGSWTIDESLKDTIMNNDPNFNTPGRIVLACAPSDPNVVYALAASGQINPANGFETFWCNHIVRSSDKGITWAKKNIPWDANGQSNFAYLAWHALDIAIDPNNANTVYIGGLDIQKTTNGGGYWTRLSDWSLMYSGGGIYYIHADQHIIAYKPGSSTDILFGSDGGVFYTTSGTLDYPHFMERNQDFNTLQFYSGAIRPEWGSVEAIGGLQDNGSLYYVGIPFSPYDMVSGGDGAYCFFDKDEPNFFITSIYYNYYLVFDDGTNVNSIGDYSNSGIFVNPADYDSRVNSIYANGVDFISSVPDKYLVINNVTSYGGYFGTFKSANTGSAVYFSAVKLSPNTPVGQETLYLGTVSGKLFKLTHAESSPVTTEITGANFPIGNISSINIGNSDDTLIVTYSNYGVPSVWLSYNGGQSWMDREGNLPDMPIRWAIFYPGQSRNVLLGTETGVWSTSNINEADVVWSPDVNGMANVRTDMLDFRNTDNTVLAATHGRGLYTAVWDVLESIDRTNQAALNIYPNPSTGPVYLNGLEGTGSVTVRIMDPSGKIISDNKITAGSGSSFQIADLTGLARGVYLAQVEAGGRKLATKKIVKE